MKQIKALLGLAVVIAAFYAAFKIMPPYYNQLQFQDAVETEARTQSYTTKSKSEIRDIIVKKGAEQGITLRPQQVEVHRSGAEVSIGVDYVVHVDMAVYPFDLNFHAGSKNRGM